MLNGPNEFPRISSIQSARSHSTPDSSTSSVSAWNLRSSHMVSARRLIDIGPLLISGQQCIRYASGMTFLFSHHESNKRRQIVWICSTAFSRSDRYGIMADNRLDPFDASKSRRLTGTTQSGNAENGQGRMLISLSGNPFASGKVLRGTSASMHFTRNTH